MEQDFSKKIKNKRRRKGALIVLIIVIAVGILMTTKIEGAKGFVNRLTGNNKVTIEIRCDELSKDMSQLKKPELEKYIPKDGIILKTTEYPVDKDTTVFDVLDAACKEHDIQIEYSYTPIYKSYYIEGINYLYEFDGGKRSGWTFTVDDEYPEYGASKIKLYGGEKIVWSYTCDYTKNDGIKTSKK